MTIKATFFTIPACFKNRHFDIHDHALSHDDALHGLHALRQKLADRGIDLSTQDLNPPEGSEFVLFSEMPAALPAPNGHKNYLLIIESELIRPDNWDLQLHRQFDKIFTWHDRFIDNKKYFKINVPCNLNAAVAPDLGSKTRFCALIAGYKYVRSPLELYSHRIKAIRWFETNHPEDFDLYGMGWDAPLTLKSAARAFYHWNPRAILDRDFPSYRGTVESKIEVLKRYKFSICFENAKDIPGYITEKMIHCFLAGCVPVYWGAPNVQDHIPQDAFIDFRDFKSYDDLYRYLKGLPDREYEGYLQAIQRFLKSEKARPFGVDFFAEQITEEILEDLRPK